MVGRIGMINHAQTTSQLWPASFHFDVDTCIAVRYHKLDEKYMQLHSSINHRSNRFQYFLYRRTNFGYVFYWWIESISEWSRHSYLCTSVKHHYIKKSSAQMYCVEGDWLYIGFGVTDPHLLRCHCYFQMSRHFKAFYAKSAMESIKRIFWICKLRAYQRHLTTDMSLCAQKPKTIKNM